MPSENTKAETTSSPLLVKFGNTYLRYPCRLTSLWISEQLEHPGMGQNGLCGGTLKYMYRCFLSFTWGLLNFRDSRLLAKPSGRYILVGPGSRSQPGLSQALLLIAHAQTGQAEDFHPLSDRPTWVVSWKTSSSKVM